MNMNYIEAIKAFKPTDEREVAVKRVLLSYIETFKENILTRENELAHLTSSGFILNKDLTHCLMVYHHIYKTWSWTGGHADGDQDLLYVAIKEAQEETGIKKVEPLTEDIVSLDILPVVDHIKKGKYIVNHMHLNVTYLLIADEHQELCINEAENSDVRWLEVDQLETYCQEPKMVEIYKRLIKRAESYLNVE